MTTEVIDILSLPICSFVGNLSRYRPHPKDGEGNVFSLFTPGRVPGQVQREGGGVPWPGPDGGGVPQPGPDRGVPQPDPDTF